MSTWVVFAAVGLGTLALRAAFLVAPRVQLRPTATRLIGFMGPAVLAALASSALFAQGGRTGLPPATYLAAVFVAAVVGVRHRTLAAAMAAGLVTFVCLEALV